MGLKTLPTENLAHFLWGFHCVSTKTLNQNQDQNEKKYSGSRSHCQKNSSDTEFDNKDLGVWWLVDDLKCLKEIYDSENILLLKNKWILVHRSVHSVVNMYIYVLVKTGRINCFGTGEDPRQRLCMCACVCTCV